MNNDTDIGCAKTITTKNGNYNHLKYERRKYNDKENDYSKRKRSTWRPNGGITEEYIKSIYETYNNDEKDLFYKISTFSKGAYKIKCKECGFEFYSLSNKAKYCSQRCINDAYIKRRRYYRTLDREKTCPICKQPFIGCRNDTIYCSKKCKQIAYRKNKIKKQLELKIKIEDDVKKEEYYKKLNEKCDECRKCGNKADKNCLELINCTLEGGGAYIEV